VAILAGVVQWRLPAAPGTTKIGVGAASKEQVNDTSVPFLGRTVQGSEAHVISAVRILATVEKLSNGRLLSAFGATDEFRHIDGTADNWRIKW